MLNTANIGLIKSEITDNITIVAATKTVPAEYINRLQDYGITIAGENRVQELLAKFDKVRGMDWHFIGRLQTNKVKYIADKVSMIQSLDRIGLADEIQKQCKKINRIMDVLIEINVGEESKGGVKIKDIYDLADYVLSQPNLRLKGLMCIPSINADESVYKSVSDLYNAFKLRYKDIQYLSLGMSDDYKLAIKYGANMIRPGRILFGKREG